MVALSSLMTADEAESVREMVDAVCRTESGRVLATLIRLLGDFDLAEEALHDAFRAALEQWPRDGVPANPRAWLVSTGRFEAIDEMRRRARFEASLTELAERLDAQACDRAARDDETVGDDRLRLVFTCCHPPLRVIYLVFNEVYSASSGGSLTRHDLSGEAIRLGRLLIELLPEPDAVGLLALMLLHDSRRAARTSPTGDLTLLDDQDRSLWNRDQIAEGADLVKRALSSGRLVHTASGDCRGACRGASPRHHGLRPDRGALRRADAGRFIARGRTEPRCDGGDARRQTAGYRWSLRGDPRTTGRLFPHRC